MLQTVFIPPKPRILKILVIACTFKRSSGGLVSNKSWCEKGEKARNRWLSLEYCLISGGT